MCICVCGVCVCVCVCALCVCVCALCVVCVCVCVCVCVGEGGSKRRGLTSDCGSISAGATANKSSCLASDFEEIRDVMSRCAHTTASTQLLFHRESSCVYVPSPMPSTSMSHALMCTSTCFDVARYNCSSFHMPSPQQPLVPTNKVTTRNYT